VTQWVAYHNEHNRLVEWWPDHYDEPVWSGSSIYTFVNGLKYHDGMALFEWPDELDEDAEVIL